MKERDGSTSIYRSYYQLLVNVGGTHTNFQPYWINTLWWAFGDTKLCFDYTFWKPNCINRLKKKFINIIVNLPIPIRTVYKWFQNFHWAFWTPNRDLNSRKEIRVTESSRGIPSGWIRAILHQHLNKKKLSARWVPRLFRRCLSLWMKQVYTTNHLRPKDSINNWLSP